MGAVILVDFNKILKSLSSNDTAKSFLGGAAGGALSSALMSKKGRKGAGKLLKYGGIAAVGTLAWKAYKDYSAKQDAQQNEDDGHGQVGETAYTKLESNSFNNLDTSDQKQAMFVMKSMVAAAMSDGHLDSNEYQNITQKADDLGLSGEDKNLIFDEISNPMSIDDVIVQASSPQLAMEVYTATLLAIDESTPQGQAYLNGLANGLRLPKGLVDAVHSQANQI